MPLVVKVEITSEKDMMFDDRMYILVTSSTQDKTCEFVQNDIVKTGHI